MWLFFHSQLTTHIARLAPLALKRAASNDNHALTSVLFLIQHYFLVWQLLQILIFNYLTKYLF